MRRFFFGFAVFAAFVVSFSPFAQAAPASRFASGLVPQTTSVFRSLGLLKGTSYYRTLALPPVKSTLTSQQSRSAAPTGDLSLTFNLHYKNSTEREQLENRRDEVLLPFFRANYLRMTAIFGQPAPEQRGRIITVELYSESFDEVRAYEPVLKPSATDGGTIYFSYLGDDSQLVNEYSFTQLILLAFYGPNIPSYNFANGDYIESYLYGMADAAALLVIYGVAGSPANFDPRQYGPYILPLYDLFNHPELGNAYIYPRTGDGKLDVPVAADFRLLMAQSAWLKVAIQMPQFFSQYNTAYYKQFPARTAVKPEQLRALAAQICPTVEGLSFQDWVRRQSALDTSVTVGQKIYVATIPLAIPATGDRRGGFLGYAEAFSTTADGDERPSFGYGSVNAFDEKGANINASSSELNASNLIDFSSPKGRGEGTFGAGFTDLGTPDRARITLKVRFKAAETTALVPYIGPETSGSSPLSYYGVSTNGDTGSLTLSSNTGVSETLTVARGAFGGTKTVSSAVQVITTLTLGGRTFVRNTAWVSTEARGLAFVLDGAGTNTSFTLKTASGASKVRMISLPFFPLESDESKILGVPATQLQLARYRPNLSPGTLKDGVIQFGITGDRHEIYPNISAPMAPGRGYWLGVSGDFSRTIKGTEPSSRVYEVPVLGGWNQIGVPFNRAFAPAAIKVRYGGFAAVPLATAITNGWVRPGIWRWLGRGGYERVDSDSTSKLQPFEGYYLYAVPARGVFLVFDVNASSEPTALALQASSWSVPLTVSTNATSDRSNRFGVSNLIAAAKPPAGATVVTLRFLSSGDATDDAGGAGAASGWADSFLKSLERAGEWKFKVEGATKNQRVTLSWGNLAGLPSDVKLTLTDEKTARSQGLVASGSYKWTADGAVRDLTIKATRSARPDMAVKTADSRGVEITVSLNIAAPGHLEIRDATGDTIALIKSGDFKAGVQKFLWSGSLVNGKTAPAGNYRAFWIPQLEGDKGTSRGFSLR